MKWKNKMSFLLCVISLCRPSTFMSSLHALTGNEQKNMLPEIVIKNWNRRFFIILCGTLHYWLYCLSLERAMWLTIFPGGLCNILKLNNHTKEKNLVNIERKVRESTIYYLKAETTCRENVISTFMTTWQKTPNWCLANTNLQIAVIFFFFFP